jgi:hypothetical protein
MLNEESMMQTPSGSLVIHQRELNAVIFHYTVTLEETDKQVDR